MAQPGALISTVGKKAAGRMEKPFLKKCSKNKRLQTQI